MPRSYYWLIVKYNHDDDYSIAFGDYVRRVVTDEMRDAYSDCVKKTIVKMPSDEQAAIDAYLEDINS